MQRYMELDKVFNYQNAEKNWYDHWVDSGYFQSKPDHREPYTIVMPPPNVTGILHMGHCLNNTIQDILARRERMKGKNVCWVPGTDHASIATEAKVVQMLREKGIAKSSLSREEFLSYAWEWKEKYGGIILQQLKKLGCSLDWSRTSFTMDPDYYRSVTGVFIDLYKKGCIYRGKRMIHWDVKAKTALSDEEVIRKETHQTLYHLAYALESTDGKPSDTEKIIIATVRPETIMGDTAICVNPEDPRYIHLHGRFAYVPLINRRIPIIADEYVTMDFGTGALKVTPAHDTNDYQLGMKHQLEIIDIFHDDGTLSDAAVIYVGQDRLDVRKQIAKELDQKGILIKTEDYTSEVGYSERTDAVVEPRLSLQWWVDMKKISTPAIDVINNGDIEFYPAKFKNLYRHWMENIKDWCISRQLWWGHRIPAWYDKEGNVYVAADEQEARAQYAKHNNIEPDALPPTTNLLSQDEDCLDTWFSSWLWPFEVFKGYSHPGNPEISYYYPTNTLVTAPEIIFFWVARMIMAGMEFQNQIPFREVYFTGIVRDKQGRKMSKSLGNSPDLLELIDRYGADACRFGIMISSPAGNDLLWDESSNEQGRNFTNKLWNALKLIRLWEQNGLDKTTDAGHASFAIQWMDQRIAEASAQVAQQFREFRLSEALKTIYSLIWDDFCSWYLEWVKPPFGEKMSANVYHETIRFYESLMRLLHPFMPFITEEIYHQLKERAAGDDITISPFSEHETPNPDILKKGQYLKDAITAIRDARVKQQLKPKDPIELLVNKETLSLVASFGQILSRQTHATQIHLRSDDTSGMISVLVNKDPFYIKSEKAIDTQSQKEQMLKDLAYYEGFLNSVDKKLSNEKFIQHAKPEIIENEKKKKADAEIKIQTLKQSIEAIQ
jgi:valyl-tRNA synthetase